MDLVTAKSLKTGATVITPAYFNSDGTPQRWKVTSVKTWKRDSSRIEIGLKRGLREYTKIDQDQLHYIEATGY